MSRWSRLSRRVGAGSLHSVQMITLEYLQEGGQDCPLVRLYDYGPSDLAALRDLCLALAAGRLEEVSLDNQPWVNAIGSCRFVLRRSRISRGVRAPTADAPFVMEYTNEGWLEVADKISALERAGGYQWLTIEGDVNVLLSPDGHW